MKKLTVVLVLTLILSLFIEAAYNDVQAASRDLQKLYWTDAHNIDAYQRERQETAEVYFGVITYEYFLQEADIDLAAEYGLTPRSAWNYVVYFSVSRNLAYVTDKGNTLVYKG